MIFGFIFLALVKSSSKFQINKIGDTDKGWYFSQLTKYQRPFYQALDIWLEKGQLKGSPQMFLDNKEGGIEEVVDPNLIISYATGMSTALNRHFLSAVAAWRFDHPEVFYFDPTHLSFRLSSDSEGHHKILFGCLEYESLLWDYIDPNQVDTLISNFNGKVNEMVNEANKKTNDFDKIKAVHDRLKAVKYTKPENAESDAVRNFLYSPYGSLVNQKSVCDGYAKAFQICMNKLQIKSIHVPGNALDEKGESQSHSWNLVMKDDGYYYVVDCTYDSTTNTDNWFLIPSNATLSTHFPNGELDSCTVTFHFPPVPSNSDKWSAVYFEYNDWKQYNVSYMGLNASALLRIYGTRLCYRNTQFDKDGVLHTIPWVDFIEYLRLAQQQTPETYSDTETYTQMAVADNVKTIQFGVCKDDVNHFATPGSKQYFVDERDIVDFTEPIETGNNLEYLNISSGKTNPVVRYFSPTPRHFFPGYEYNFVFTLSEVLTPEDPSDINYKNFHLEITGVSLNNYDRNAGTAKQLGEEAVKCSILRDVRIIDERTVGFTFKPSDYYAHDYVEYNISLKGIKGIVSGLSYQPFIFFTRFFPNNGGTNTCSKMFGKGTLYVAGRPVLIANEDITNQEFQDKDGNKINAKGYTSSDIALVATRKDEGDHEPMSATFDISLSLYCISYLIKPNMYNSPLTVQLPFPAGFDPEKNKDVSFKVVHYKGDNTIEENTVVVGPTGLLITVNSFSPFQILPVKKSAKTLASDTYPLYISATGKTPTVKIENSENNVINQVISYKKGKKITIIPSSNTVIDKIYLNGKQIHYNDKEGIILQEQDLNERSNIFEVFIVTEQTKKTEENNKVTPIYVTSDLTIKAYSNSTARAIDNGYTLVGGSDDIDDVVQKIIQDIKQDEAPSNNNNTGLIVGVVVAVVVVAAVVAVVVVLVIKKKRSNRNNNSDIQVADDINQSVGI